MCCPLSFTLANTTNASGCADLISLHHVTRFRTGTRLDSSHLSRARPRPPFSTRHLASARNSTRSFSIRKPDAAPQIEEARVILKAVEQRIFQDCERAGPELRVLLVVGVLEPIERALDVVQREENGGDVG
jgi:hypothetical protein